MELDPLGTKYLIDYSHRTACTCGPLVYVRTLKCASTFFWHSFNQKFGWEEIKFDDINWQTQHVFSYIMDPRQRRVKGVTEFVWMHQTQDQLLDPAYRTFIQQTPVLDYHTVSYYDNFGNRCNQIDWIPIADFSQQTVADLTSRLLFENGIRIFNQWHWPFAHKSEPEKKLLEQQISQCLTEVATPAVDKYLQQDMLLYQQVANQFSPNGHTWAEASWLR